MADASAQLRRRARRFSTSEAVRFSCPSSSGSARLLNASETGVFVVTELPPKPGERVCLELIRESPPIHLEGEVRWNSLEADTLPSGFGVELTQAGPNYARFIESLRQAEALRR